MVMEDFSMQMVDFMRENGNRGKYLAWVRYTIQAGVLLIWVNGIKYIYIIIEKMTNLTVKVQFIMNTLLV